MLSLNFCEKVVVVVVMLMINYPIARVRKLMRFASLQCVRLLHLRVRSIQQQPRMKFIHDSPAHHHIISYVLSPQALEAWVATHMIL